MVSVGDRIRLMLNKGAAREGDVTETTGSMLRVRWTSGEESTVIPGPGTLTVLGRAASAASRPRTQTTAAAKRSTTKKATSKAAAATRASGTKKAGPRTVPAKTASTRRPGASKKDVSKGQPAPKRTAQRQTSRRGGRSG